MCGKLPLLFSRTNDVDFSYFYFMITEHRGNGSLLTVGCKYSTTALLDYTRKSLWQDETGLTGYSAVRLDRLLFPCSGLVLTKFGRGFFLCKNRDTI